MDYFPQSLAAGEAFCNRKEEQVRIKYNLEESRPTLLVSPRRYGKTSLALQTIKKVDLHYAQFDFLSAVSVQNIENIILKGVGQLLNRVEKGHRKALKLATDLFSGLSIKLSSDSIGLSIEINKKTTDPATSILNILERVEKLSERYDEKIVLLFDEFQRIYQICNDHSIESVIRQVAQATKRLSFVFSGSNRHLLNQIFNDRNRPFYKLCDRITLERIEAEDYSKYITDVAIKTGRILEEGVIDRIMGRTERHPYYVNLLCSRLWRKKKINNNLVDSAWRDYTFEERSQVANELDLLSNSQRKLLAALARSGGTNAPRGQEFQSQSEMPGATIAQSLSFLEKNDFVYIDTNHYYQVLDPVIKRVLSDG